MITTEQSTAGAAKATAGLLWQDFSGPLRKFLQMRTHTKADADDLLQDVFRRHVIDDQAVRQVLRGAEESLAIERSFQGAVASAMAEMEG